MKTINHTTLPFLPLRRVFVWILTAFSLFAFSFLSGCSQTIDYFSYVSELRSNIFLAEADGFFLRAYAVKKESPYSADGTPREINTLCQVYLTAPSNVETYQISFHVKDKEYGGEMSFDNVKTQYYFSCSIDVDDLPFIEFTLSYKEQTVLLKAETIKTDDTITPKKALEFVRIGEPALFKKMTDKYGFTGEIHIRLLYEDAPYYYVGIIGRDGKTTAFLLNGETGKILAKRES